jgi:hypothetical protein
MRGAVLYGPRDVRFEERDAPTLIKPTDAMQGLRPDPAPRPGGRGLPRDGRAPRDRDAAAPVRRFAPPNAMGHGTDPEHFASHPAQVIARSEYHMTRSKVTTMTGKSPLITVNNGVKMPALGLGVYRSSPEQTGVRSNPR